MLFTNKHAPVLIFFVILVTSAVYASYLLLSNFHLCYPHWVLYRGTEEAPYFFGIYNLVFIGRAVFIAFRKKETELV
jgi:hypothetical protein